jgi:predicted ArsR family transcriptional regulator
MPTEPPESTTDLPPVPSSLESPRTKLIWVTIAAHGPLAITELGRALDIPLLTLLPHLSALHDRGLVRRHQQTIHLDSVGAKP